MSLGLTAALAGAALAQASETARTKRAIDLAAAHMVKMQTPDGLFRYEMRFDGKRPTQDVSIVRQAGAGFALAEYLAVERSPPVVRAVGNALEALRRRSIQFRKRDRWLVSGDGSFKGARTGATALALLTEVLYYRATGSGRFEQARNNWLNGLLALRLRNRGFRRSAVSKRESPYFNGEAWLALAQHDDAFRTARVAAALASLDAYLLERYARKPDIGFFHWGVMAAAVRYRRTRDLRFLTFIEQQTRHYLRVLRPELKPGSNTCYALEGLLTASALLARHWPTSEIRPDLAERLDADIDKNLTFQLLDPEGLSGRTTGPANDALSPADFKGLFFARAKRTYARIDHTQHCLSAFVRLHRAPRAP